MTNFGTQKIAGSIAGCQNTATFQKKSTFLCSQILAKILLWMIASPPTSQNCVKKSTLVGTGLWPKETDKDSLTAREVAIIVDARPAQIQTQPQFAHVDLKTGSYGNERRRRMRRRRSKRVFEVFWAQRFGRNG